MAPAEVDEGAKVSPCLLRHPSPTTTTTTMAEVDNGEVDQGAEVDPHLLRHPRLLWHPPPLNSLEERAGVYQSAEVDVYFCAGGCRGR